MEFSRTLPLRRDVRITSGSMLICNFKIKEPERPIKINIGLHIYCRNIYRTNVIDDIISDLQSIHISKDNNVHTVKIKVPEFKDSIQSFLLIQIDLLEDIDTKAYLEYMTTEEIFMNGGTTKNLRNESLQAQAAMAVPNLRPKIGDAPLYAISKSEPKIAEAPSQTLQKTLYQDESLRLKIDDMPCTIPKSEPKIAEAPSQILQKIQYQDESLRLKIDDMSYTTARSEPKIAEAPSQILQKIQYQDESLRLKIDDMSYTTARSGPKTADDISQKIQYGLAPAEQINKIMLASSWNIKCGIATYTKYLLDELKKIDPDIFVVNPIIKGELETDVNGKLTHLQHEFGIVPVPPKIDSKIIITWHTVFRNMREILKMYEARLNVMAHIVHSEGAQSCINSSRDVWIVPHGSMLIADISKEDARKALNIDIDKKIGFVFGFQSKNKNYRRLVNAAKNTGIDIIISGAKHEFGADMSMPDDKNVISINRFLTDEEVNLYASASDILFFDYIYQDHYSVSGSMHRIIGAGRPVICSDIRHFSDVTDMNNVLKFKDQKELEFCIKYALDNPRKFGRSAKEYAKETSWKNVAKKHMEIYRKYIDI